MHSRKHATPTHAGGDLHDSWSQASPTTTRRVLTGIVPPSSPQQAHRQLRRGSHAKKKKQITPVMVLSGLLLVCFLCLVGIYGWAYRTIIRNPQPLSSPTTTTRDESSFFQSSSHKQFELIDKKGQVIHKSITRVAKEDLEHMGVDVKALPPGWETMTHDQAIQGREVLVDILKDAGVDDLDVAAILSLPTWSQVTKLYGGNDGPVIVGMDRCEEFRQSVNPREASIGIAGMFNTGTNPFNMYLESNCKMPKNKKEAHKGMRWQVPWGKHSLASFKWTNTVKNDERVNKTAVLPVAIVRDPYSWMQSMCKHPYEARWPHTRKHCPNLVPTADDYALIGRKGGAFANGAVNVTIKYNPHMQFDSMAHYWSRWYQEYIQADYPRLIIRFEDLQFHAKELISSVCQCAGAVPKQENDEFSYIVDSAKSWGTGHRGKQTNMISGMIKYGTDKNRFKSMTREDLEYASQALDPTLMQLFEYEIPSV